MQELKHFLEADGDDYVTYLKEIIILREIHPVQEHLLSSPNTLNNKKPLNPENVARIIKGTKIGKALSELRTLYQKELRAEYKKVEYSKLLKPTKGPESPDGSKNYKEHIKDFPEPTGLDWGTLSSSSNHSSPQKEDDKNQKTSIELSETEAAILTARILAISELNEKQKEDEERQLLALLNTMNAGIATGQDFSS